MGGKVNVAMYDVPLNKSYNSSIRCILYTAKYFTQTVDKDSYS